MLKDHLDEGMEAGELYNLVPIPPNQSRFSFSLAQALNLSREMKGGESDM